MSGWFEGFGVDTSSWASSCLSVPQSTSIPLSTAIRLLFQLFEDELSLFRDYWGNKELLQWIEYKQLTIEVWNNFASAILALASWLFWSVKPIYTILYWFGYRIAYYGYLLVQKMLPSVFNASKVVAQYAQDGFQMFVNFEKNLTKEQHYIQASIIGTIIALYLLHKWFQTTTLFQRIRHSIEEKINKVKCRIDRRKRKITNWFSQRKRRINNFYLQKKRRITKTYRRIVKRISEVSLLLAMATPHMTYIGLAICIKLLIPTIITWLATETYAITLLSWWYPLLCTLVLLHEVSKSSTLVNKDDEKRTNRIETSSPSKSKWNMTASSSPSSKNSSNKQPSKSSKSSGVHPRMTRAARLRQEETSRRLREKKK